MRFILAFMFISFTGTGSKKERPHGHNAKGAEEIVNCGDGPWSRNLRTATVAYFLSTD